MKLSLLTHKIALSWDLPSVIDTAQRLGFAGVEFRVDANHAHGVELGRSKDERRVIREQIEDAYLEVAGIGTGCRLDWPEPDKRREVIDQAKRYIELASDLGCGRVRVFGNDIPDDVDRRDCIGYVAEGLHTLAEFAEPVAVDVLLEMHGQFNFWGFARSAVDAANHPNVGILYNCDQRDVVGGSITATYSRVRQWVRHVHMHELSSGFPYSELFGLLAADGYEGYLSPEISVSDPTPEQYLSLYATLARSWVHDALTVAAPRHNRPC